MVPLWFCGARHHGCDAAIGPGSHHCGQHRRNRAVEQAEGLQRVVERGEPRKCCHRTAQGTWEWGRSRGRGMVGEGEVGWWCWATPGLLKWMKGEIGRRGGCKEEWGGKGWPEQGETSVQSPAGSISVGLDGLTNNGLDAAWSSSTGGTRSPLQLREGTRGCQPHFFWEMVKANLPQHGSQAASLLRCLGSPLLLTDGPAATPSTQTKPVFVITSVARVHFQLQEQH